MSDDMSLSSEEELELSQDFSFWSLMKFVFPSIFAFVFIAVYQMVDGYFIQKFVGDLAISAVDLYYPVICLFIAIGIMLGTGGNAIIVKKIGEGKREEASKTFSNTVLFTFVLGIFLTVICLVFANPIMKICGATSGTIVYLKPYYYVMSSFALTIIFQTELGIMIIGEGKSVIAAIVIMVGGVLNCVLDFVFMKYLGWGIMGAAIATVIGYFSTILYSVYYYIISKSSLYEVRFSKMNMKEIGAICFNGSSDMISNMVGGVSALCMNHIAFRCYGEVGVGALTIIEYFNFFIEAIFMGLTSAVEPVFSYHYGSGNTEMRKKVFKLSNSWILVLSVLFMILVFIFNSQIVGIFFDEGTEIYDITKIGIRICLFSCAFVGFNTFFSGLFTAFSNGLISGLLSLIRTLIVLIACLYILSAIFGGTGLWMAIPVSEVISFIICLIFIVKYKNRYEYM